MNIAICDDEQVFLRQLHRNAENFCVNGNVATNGTIVSNGNMNINGTRTENADESMIFIFDKIDNQYFSAPNVDEYDEDYSHIMRIPLIWISTFAKCLLFP